MMQAPPAASAPAVGVPVDQHNKPAAAPAAPVLSQGSGQAAPPPAAPAPAPAPTGGLKGMNPMLIIAGVLVIIMVIALVVVIVKVSK